MWEDCPVCKSKEFAPVTIRKDRAQIVRCLSCGHIYLNPTIEDEALKDIFEEYYIYKSDHEFMEIIGGWFNDSRGPYQYALEFTKKNPGFEGKSVLEVGCGAGRFLAECQRFGAFVVGVDPSREAGRLAKKYFDLDIIPKTLEQAVAEKYLLPDQFNLIFAFEVIEHTRKPGEFIETLSGLLKPGGLLFISTPNFELFHLMGNAASVVADFPEHIHFFTSESLTGLLRRYNLILINMSSTNLLTYSDRQKIVLVKNSFIGCIWKKLRKITFLYSLKNVIFRVLDGYRQKADLENKSGLNLVALCRRPEQVRDS